MSKHLYFFVKNHNRLAWVCQCEKLDITAAFSLFLPKGIGGCIMSYSHARLKALLARVDHTLLKVDASEADFIRLTDEASEYEVACICVPPSRVSFCANRLAGKIAVGSVTGFPNGYNDPEAKAYEAERIISLGAVEIDMVIDIGKVKDGNYAYILEDIRRSRKATEGYILKVIIETALLTADEKIKLCKVVSESGADFIKTSTGFAGGGATPEDVELLRKHTEPHVKVKAAGGINSLEDAFCFAELGADRLGTSRIVKLAKGINGCGY